MRDADAVIRDFQHRIGGVAAMHKHAATGWRIFHCIGKEIGEDVTQQAFVAVSDRRNVRIEIQFDFPYSEPEHPHKPEGRDWNR